MKNNTDNRKEAAKAAKEAAKAAKEAAKAAKAAAKAAKEAAQALSSDEDNGFHLEGTQEARRRRPCKT